MTTLSNPAYHQLLIHLGQAKGHLDAAKRIADELVRDRMLTDECVLLAHALGDVTYSEARIRQKASNH